MPVPSSARWLRIVGVIIVALTIVLVTRRWWINVVVPPSSPIVDTVGYRPECPTHEFITARGQVTSIALSPTTGLIPEFNDCQRLLVGENYGPLVAIFAAEVLADSGVLNSLTVSTGFAVATIYAYDDSYPSLGIQKEFNCLYLFAGPQAAVLYTARMVPRIDEKCPETSESSAGVPLRVFPSKEHPEDAIPPVARWDHTGEIQYIGIKCGKFWCSIGPMNPSWTPQAARVPPSSAGPDETPTYLIKGYHDQQRLAPPTGKDWDHTGTPASDEWVGPTGILGTIVPEPGVGGLTAADYAVATERWRKVATTYLEGADVGAYREKYGFAATPSPDQGNEVRLCDPSSAACPDLPAGLENIRSCISVRETVDAENAKGGHSSRWYAKVKPADGGGEKFLCVIRREHPGLPGTGIRMPSTARWRWLLDDDSIWVPCIFSCCQLQGGF